MLHQYEKRTGEMVSLGDLESGSLKSKLTEDDYNIKDMVSIAGFTLSHLIHPWLLIGK